MLMGTIVNAKRSEQPFFYKSSVLRFVSCVEQILPLPDFFGNEKMLDALHLFRGYRHLFEYAFNQDFMHNTSNKILERWLNYELSVNKKPGIHRVSVL